MSPPPPPQSAASGRSRLDCESGRLLGRSAARGQPLQEISGPGGWGPSCSPRRGSSAFGPPGRWMCPLGDHEVGAGILGRQRLLLAGKLHIHVICMGLNVLAACWQLLGRIRPRGWGWQTTCGGSVICSTGQRGWGVTHRPAMLMRQQNPPRGCTQARQHP